MSSFKRFMCGALAALTLFNAAPPTFASETDLTPKIFSVTVPTEVPIRMDKAGRVSIPQNLKIQNDSNGAIAVTDISVEGKNGWTVVDWTQPTEGKQFAMRFRGDSTKSDGSVALKAGWTVAKKNSLSINAEAKMAKQEKSTKTDIAVINWAFDWAGAGGQETKPEPPKNPDYNIDDDVTKPDDGYNIGDDVTKPEHPINPPVDDRTYTITILPGDHGYAEADSPLKTDKDGIVPVLPVVIPDEGYVFDRWIDENGDEIMAGDTLDNDIAIKPIFTPEEYDNTRTLTPIDGEHGKVNDKTPIETDKNGVVQDNLPNVTPEDGFAFEKWVDGDGNEVRPGDVLDRDVTIKPVFTEIDDTHTLTPVDGEHGTVDDKTPVQTDKHGVVLNNLPSVTPEDGYEFEKWVYADNGEDARPGDILDRDVTIKPVFQEKQLLFSVDYKNGLMLPESSNTATFAWDNAPDDFELAGITSSDPSIAKVSKVFDSANESQKVEVKALKRGIAKFTGVSTTGETADFDVLVSELGDSRPTANIDKAEEIKPGDTIEPDDITVEIPTVTPDGGSDTVTVTPNDVSGGEIEEGKNVVSATVDANGVDITINIIINITINQGTPVDPTDHTHTITINPDGGNGHADSSDPLETDRNGKVPELPTVTLDEGYVFDKWVNEAGDEVKTGDTIDDDVTITPSFEPDENYKVYTITIEPGEHGRADDDSPLKTDANGTVPALPSVTTDEGYVFDKWVDEGVSEVKQGNTLTRDITITPITRLNNTHTITPIDGDHGTVTDKTPIQTDTNGIVQDNLPSVISDSGYEFTNYVDQNGKKIRVGDTITEDITIMPEFKEGRKVFILIPVNTENGSISNMSPIKTNEEGVVQDNLPDVAPKTDYKFVKWVDNDGNEVKVGDTLSKDITIRPVYQYKNAVSNKSYTVYFSVGDKDYPATIGLESAVSIKSPENKYNTLSWAKGYEYMGNTQQYYWTTNGKFVYATGKTPGKYWSIKNGDDTNFTINCDRIYRSNGHEAVAAPALVVITYEDGSHEVLYEYDATPCSQLTLTLNEDKIKNGETVVIGIAMGAYIVADNQEQFTISFEDGDHGKVTDKSPIILQNCAPVLPELPSVESDENYRFVNWIRTDTGEYVNEGSEIFVRDNMTGITLRPVFAYANSAGFSIGIREGNHGIVTNKTSFTTDEKGVIPNLFPAVKADPGYLLDKWVNVYTGEEVKPGDILSNDIIIKPIFVDDANGSLTFSVDAINYNSTDGKLGKAISLYLNDYVPILPSFQRTYQSSYKSGVTTKWSQTIRGDATLQFRISSYANNFWKIRYIQVIRENGNITYIYNHTSDNMPTLRLYNLPIRLNDYNKNESVCFKICIEQDIVELPTLTRPYTITPVDGDHGVVSDHTILQTDEWGFILKLPDVIADSGYKHVGWVDQNGYVVKGNPNGDVIHSDITITPVFEKLSQYTISFVDSDYGTIQDKTPVLTDESGYIRPYSLPDVKPNSALYALDHWVDVNTGDVIRTGMKLDKDITIRPVLLGSNARTLTPVPIDHATFDLTPVQTDGKGVVQNNLPEITLDDYYKLDKWVYVDTGEEVHVGDMLVRDVEIKPIVFYYDGPFQILFETADYYTLSSNEPVTAKADNLVPMDLMPSVIPIASHYFDNIWVNVETGEVVDGQTKLKWDITVRPQINCLFTENNGAVTGFSDYAQDKNVESITIPNNIMGKTVTRIGEHAFSAHHNYRQEDGKTYSDPNPKAMEVKHVVLQEGFTVLEEEAFGSANIFECMALESIELPKGLKIIGEEAFYECTNLKSIVIPDTVTTIDDAAFLGCGLESIHLGKSVRSLGFRAFMWCDSLTYINLPYSLRSIGERCFESAGLESVTVPDGCTVGEQAFIFCENLKTATLGEGTTSLYCTFQRCTNLKTVRLPKSITSINPNAFYYCPNLAYIYIKRSRNSVSGAPWSSSQTHPTVIWTS